MFPISIDDAVEGFVTDGDRKLKGQLTRDPQWKIDNLHRGWTARVKFRLWLESNDAAYLKSELEMPNARPSFRFQNVKITIRGASQSPRDYDIEPKPITFNFGGVE